MHDDWDELLDDAQFTDNDPWQDRIQETSFMLHADQHPLTSFTNDTLSNVPTAVEHTLERLEAVEQAQKCLAKAQ